MNDDECKEEGIAFVVQPAMKVRRAVFRAAHRGTRRQWCAAGIRRARSHDEKSHRISREISRKEPGESGCARCVCRNCRRGISGVAKIKVEADVLDFLPPGYLKDWVIASDDEFSRGQGIEVYSMPKFDYAADYALGTNSVLKQAAAAFKENPYVQDESVDPWTDAFDNYIAMCEIPAMGMPVSWKTENCVNASANTYNDKLYKFITHPSSPGGYRYVSDVKFDTTTTPPTIVATRMRARKWKAKTLLQPLKLWILSARPSTPSPATNKVIFLRTTKTS